jgi:hypothetical protein
MNLVEMFCNVSLFYEQIRSTENVSHMLSQTVVKKRLRSNAFNLFGQFFTWFAECLPLAVGIVILLIEKEEIGREALAFLKIFRYILIPAVEIATSPPIKRYVLNYFS